jgi:hypothetical protein
MDRGADLPSGPIGFRVTPFTGYELELVADDDALLAAMSAHGRRDVRRAERNGITVEEVDPVAEPGFATEYYGQVTNAFARRGSSPPYPVERVHAAIRHLHPSGRMVLLRSRGPGGEPAATGIFLGLPGATAFFWMGASERSLQHLLPNEALMWEALLRWRDRGAVRFDFGGGGQYKAKYGGDEITVPWLRRSRYDVLESARSTVIEVARRRRRTYRPLHP